MSSAADKIEAIVLRHDNPEKVWTVTEAINAVEQKFHRRYAPSYMQEVLTLLSANGPYPGHRSIFHRINKDAYKLLPPLIVKRKREIEIGFLPMNAADKLEEAVLSYNNPEAIWGVDKAIAAVAVRFGRRYSPSYMSEMLSTLCCRRLTSDDRDYLPAVLVRVGAMKFKLLPALVEKRNQEIYGPRGKQHKIPPRPPGAREVTDVPTPKPLGLHRQPPKLTHLHFIDVVSVDETYYHRLTEDADLLKKVREVVRKDHGRLVTLRGLRELLENTEKPSVKLSRKGRALALERISKPHRNVRRHTEGLTWRMKQALLAPAFNVTGNTARGLAHRDLAVEKKGRYFKTTLGEHVTVYLKMQGEHC